MIRNEDGSSLVVAMMVLALLTIIGSSSINTAVFETEIAGNDKGYKVAFNNADSGIYVIPKLVSDALVNKATPNIANPAPFTYLDTGSSDTASGTSTFFRELAGFELYDTAPDVSFRNDGTHTIAVDVERLRSVTMAGGGAEFAGGAEGFGTSLKGVYFGIYSQGAGPNGSSSRIDANYLKVIGAAGGM